MSEEETTETTDTTETTEQQPEQEVPAQDTDWKAEARKWEQRAKANKDAAARLQELEDAQKSEQEKLTEKLSVTEKRAAEAELRAARLEVATEKGLPSSAVKFLTGDTAEELAASADELLGLLKKDEPGPSGRPKERLKPGASPPGDPEPDLRQIADAILRRT